MDITSTSFNVSGLRLSVKRENKEIARAFLYFLHNDLHTTPLAYLEDLFVDEKFRGQGIGRKLVSAVIAEAKKACCYKLIATSRFSNKTAQNLYTSSGFQKHSYGFRLDLQNGK